MTENIYGIDIGSPPDGPEGSTRSLLRSYCDCGSDDDARGILDRIFTECAQPWCKDITKRVLKRYVLRTEDALDQALETESDVLLKLTARLNAMRRGLAEPITDLKAYIACSVYNSCFMRLRARSPERTRLENRLRYLLRNDKRFGLWEAGGQMIAGVSRFGGTAAAAEAVAPPYPARDLEKLVKQIFEAAGTPVTFASLIGTVASVLGIADFAPLEFDDSLNAVSSHSPADDAFDRTQRLNTLWQEVLDLPANQRAALLLNLRDEEGQGVIELITATGLASFESLAAGMGMSVEQLRQIWDELPIEDDRIAASLSITRQQVINLRKSARSRLARRMERHDNLPRFSASGPDVGQPRHRGEP